MASSDLSVVVQDSQGGYVPPGVGSNATYAQLNPSSPSSAGGQPEKVLSKSSRQLNWAQLILLGGATLFYLITLGVPWYESNDGDRYTCYFTKTERNGSSYERRDLPGLTVLFASILLVFNFMVVIHHAIWAIVRIRLPPARYMKVHICYLVLMVLSYPVLIACFVLIRIMIKEDCDRGTSSAGAGVGLFGTAFGFTLFAITLDIANFVRIRSGEAFEPTGPTIDNPL